MALERSFASNGEMACGEFHTYTYSFIYKWALSVGCIFKCVYRINVKENYLNLVHRRKYAWGQLYGYQLDYEPEFSEVYIEYW